MPDRFRETLRSAATLIRANADGATPGPRDIELFPGDLRVYVSDSQGCIVAMTGSKDVPRAVADARHIATWRTGPALAVATLLDGVADRHHEDEHLLNPGSCGGCNEGAWPCIPMSEALAIAEACLYPQPTAEAGGPAE